MPHYKFEKLEVWHLAKTFAIDTYSLLESFPQKEKYSLKQQLSRSSISVSLNIAEGSERGSDKEFARYLLIANGSLVETVSGFYLAKDLKYIDQAHFKLFYDKSHTLSRKIFALIQKMNAT